MIVNHSTDTCKCIIANQLSEIRNIVNILDDLAIEWGMSKKLKNQLNLVVEEVVSNIMKYAYPDENNHLITLEFCNEGNYIEIKVVDDGKTFNFLEAKTQPDIEASVDDRKVGGLGIHLINSIMDSVDYKRIDNKNVLILTKNI
ncbi:MAG: ATP-binding protein [Salinivirgaceae bacterium]|jgi:serine/threonine-protein kinase RsbW|nr:ATP-binding protein [Salinivirgaceae bacterium]